MFSRTKKKKKCMKRVDSDWMEFEQRNTSYQQNIMLSIQYLCNRLISTNFSNRIVGSPPPPNILLHCFCNYNWKFGQVLRV